MQEIAVLSADALHGLVTMLRMADQDDLTVRFAVDGGLRVDTGRGNGWTAPLGRKADETGH